MKRKPLSVQNLARLEYVGLFLKNMRLIECYTQQEVADQVNLHRNSIYRAENAKNINLLTLLELCDFYCVSLGELFGDYE